MLNWIISSSALIVLFIALRFLLHKKLHPTLRYALWALVLLRLLIPVSPAHIPYSVSSLVESTQLSQDLERLEHVDAVEHAEDGSVLGIMHDAVYNMVVNDFVDSHTIVDYDADEEEFSRWQRASNLKNIGNDILLPIWLVGMGLVIVWFGVTNAVFFRRLRWTRQKVDFDCPRPVYTTDAVETPCLYGFFSPAIYLTLAVAEDETARQHVLSHELSHYRHRDHIWNVLRVAALALHWYNPLVWWAATLSRRDSELACDAAAIESLGEEQRSDYGGTLIALSVRPTRGRDLVLSATTMTGGKRSLRERVEAIARKPQIKAAAIFLVACITIFAVVFTFTGAVPVGESYIRNSTAGGRSPAWQFYLEEDITDVYIRTSLYKDGEFVIYSDKRENADSLLSLRLEPYWGDREKGEFRFDFHYEYKPNLLLFASEYTFGTKDDGWYTMSLKERFPDIAEDYTCSWLQGREAITFEKGDSVMLMNIAFGDNATLIFDGDLAKNPGLISSTMDNDEDVRIIVEAYFE